MKKNIKAIKVLILTLMPLDNDNRVLKEIKTISNIAEVTVISVNTKQVFKFINLSVMLESKRIFGIPGLNKIFLIFKYFKMIPVKEDYDIIHCHDLDAFVLACIYKKKYSKGSKIIYDAHEYETERNGMSIFEKLISKVFERFFIKYADKIICVSDSIANEYVRLYNIEKPALVLNTPFYRKINHNNLFREKLNIGNNKKIFLYQGGLNHGRGIEILLNTFSKINNESAVIIFMGYGSLVELVKSYVQEHNNIYFHEAVSPEILLDYTSSADFGISTIEDSCLSYRYCLPNKMFEYVMAEVPIIVSNLPEMKKLTEKYNIGIVAKENTPKELQKAITNAIGLDQELLHINLLKVKNIYNWREQEKVLLNIYKGILK